MHAAMLKISIVSTLGVCLSRFELWIQELLSKLVMSTSPYYKPRTVYMRINLLIIIENNE